MNRRSARAAGGSWEGRGDRRRCAVCPCSL